MALVLLRKRCCTKNALAGVYYFLFLLPGGLPLLPVLLRPDFFEALPAFLLPAGRPRLPFLGGRPGPRPLPAGRPRLPFFPDPGGRPLRPLPDDFCFLCKRLRELSIFRNESTSSITPSTNALFVFGLAILVNFKICLFVCAKV